MSEQYTADVPETFRELSPILLLYYLELAIAYWEITDEEQQERLYQGIKLRFPDMYIAAVTTFIQELNKAYTPEVDDAKGI